MKHAGKCILAWLSLALICVLALSSTVLASPDPCLMVYTDAYCVYHYDTTYCTVTFGDPLYDPIYDRGGEVLIEVSANIIAYDVYQAPNLTGFQPSTGGDDGYFSIGNDFNAIIDGFNNTPTTYINIIMVFEAEPSWCSPQIYVDGDLVVGDMHAIGDLVVSTPTPDGMNYSDTITKQISWSGCSGVKIWAFADEDYDGIWTDSECFSAFSHDLTVPVESRSWGAIKSLYKE